MFCNLAYKNFARISEGNDGGCTTTPCHVCSNYGLTPGKERDSRLRRPQVYPNGSQHTEEDTPLGHGSRPTDPLPREVWIRAEHSHCPLLGNPPAHGVGEKFRAVGREGQGSTSHERRTTAGDGQVPTELRRLADRVQHPGLKAGEAPARHRADDWPVEGKRLVRTSPESGPSTSVAESDRDASNQACGTAQVWSGSHRGHGPVP